MSSAAEELAEPQVQDEPTALMNGMPTSVIEKLAYSHDGPSAGRVRTTVRGARCIRESSETDAFGCGSGRVAAGVSRLMVLPSLRLLLLR